MKVNGVGKNGVLNVTGPVVYTNSIRPLLHKYKHNIYDRHDYIGLVYSDVSSFFSFLSNNFAHEQIFGKTHYSKVKEPIVFKKNMRHIQSTKELSNA